MSKSVVADMPRIVVVEEAAGKEKVVRGADGVPLIALEISVTAADAPVKAVAPKMEVKACVTSPVTVEKIPLPEDDAAASAVS